MKYLNHNLFYLCLSLNSMFLTFIKNINSIFKSIVIVYSINLFLSPSVIVAETVTISTFQTALYMDEEKTPGKGHGLLVDLVEESFKIVNRQPQTIFFTAKRAQHQLKTGRVQAYIGSSAHFSKDAFTNDLFAIRLAYVRFLFYYMKTKYPDGIHFENYDDLKPYKIQSIVGSAGERILTKLNIDFRSVPHIDQAFNMLKKNRFDLFVIIEITGNAYMQKEGNHQISSLSKPLVTVPADIVFSKKDPHFERTLSDFRKGFDQVKNNGTYLKLFRLYYENRVAPENLLEEMR